MRNIKGRILFVGDNPDICNLIVKILNRAGCESAICLPKEALTILAQNDFDSILIDWVLETDRIVEFCKKICAVAPKSSLFLFTGVASSQEVKRTISVIGEERLATLSLDTLVADVFQEPSRKSSYCSH